MRTRRAFLLFSSTMLSRFEGLIGWKIASSQPPAAARANERNSKFESASASPVGSALSSDAPERVFKVPGKDFAPSVKQFVDEFRVYWSHHQDFPIRRLFEILPINVVRDGGVDQLMGVVSCILKETRFRTQETKLKSSSETKENLQDISIFHSRGTYPHN